ncbi:uncharacterized protein LOC126853964 isoform X3 [Cataglyphis hispanica]|uniref:uncharacterized protein LOC126853964 isoform X3 n=1 Tax=Cataglyphis hispanica TaxID=1086592 RepID=UPI00217F5105|nr:uncharacterized protein LOC126853964 isoform X3 [Cataglyphis hispanica]
MWSSEETTNHGAWGKARIISRLNVYPGSANCDGLATIPRERMSKGHSRNPPVSLAVRNTCVFLVGAPYFTVSPRTADVNVDRCADTAERKPQTHAPIGPTDGFVTRESRTRARWSMPDCYYSPAGVLTSYVFLVTKFAAIGVGSRAEIVEGTDQNVIIQTIDSEISQANAYNEYVLEIHDNGCECIKYNCGCCQFIEWDTVSLNGTLCANASYLEHDYGFSVTVTYNNFTIINEEITETHHLSA